MVVFKNLGSTIVVIYYNVQDFLIKLKNTILKKIRQDKK